MVFTQFLCKCVHFQLEVEPIWHLLRVTLGLHQDSKSVTALISFFAVIAIHAVFHGIFYCTLQVISTYKTKTEKSKIALCVQGLARVLESVNYDPFLLDSVLEYVFLLPIAVVQTVVYNGTIKKKSHLDYRVSFCVLQSWHLLICIGTYSNYLFFSHHCSQVCKFQY